MFKRPHHRLIEQVLQCLNPALLEDCACLFGGGTCISLQLEEYRESRDIDFLCSDTIGYRNLRREVFEHGLRRLFTKDVELLREHRADQYGVRSIVTMREPRAGEQVPIKFEIVHEGRIQIAGAAVAGLPVPCLVRDDLFAEKLLANADRGADRASQNRDIIDLAVMEQRWGAVPERAMQKAQEAYGSSISGALEQASQYLRENPAWLERCITDLDINPAAAGILRQHFRGGSAVNGESGGPGEDSWRRQPPQERGGRKP